MDVAPLERGCGFGAVLTLPCGATLGPELAVVLREGGFTGVTPAVVIRVTTQGAVEQDGHLAEPVRDEVEANYTLAAGIANMEHGHCRHVAVLR